MNVTPYQLAERFIGMAEVPGAASNPAILAMLRLDTTSPAGDEVPWCSAFVNYIAWLLRLPRSKSLAARSWLTIGRVVSRESAFVGPDVVILKRGTGDQPGPEVTAGAPGHVGFFAGNSQGKIHLLGGNQGNRVSVAEFPVDRLLGIRRISA